VLSELFVTVTVSPIMFMALFVRTVPVFESAVAVQ